MPPPPSFIYLEVLFGFALTAVVGLAGIGLFIMLLIGGIKYLTSGGDPKAAEGAKVTLTYAIGGLLLILCSYLIILLIQTIFNVDLTHFSVFQP